MAPLANSLSYFLKPTYRTFAEQSLGLLIVLLLQSTLLLLNLALMREQYAPLHWNSKIFWVLISCTQSLSLWTLWRRHQLNNLKLESSLYLSQLILTELWLLSTFMDREPLINLVAMLLQIAATLLCTAVFWNKDRMCGLWMIPSLIWSIFLGIITMALSILNP